jgi:hypothetical protein
MVKKLSIIAAICLVVFMAFVSCGEPSNKSDTYQNNTETNQANENHKSVFNTNNINRITFYAYYGGSKGSDVPAEHLDEIINWLNSFKIDSDRKVPEVLPPGTNTIQVEIEYLDGSIVKQGMDTTIINGDVCYIVGEDAPECYDEILSKTALK